MGRPRAARQRHAGPGRFERQARPHVSFALTRYAGQREAPRRPRIARDSRAAGRGMRPRRQRAGRLLPDHSGGAGLADRSTAPALWTVSALLNSSEFGTMTRSPASLFRRVTRNLISVTVPDH